MGRGPTEEGQHPGVRLEASRSNNASSPQEDEEVAQVFESTSDGQSLGLEEGFCFRSNLRLGPALAWENLLPRSQVRDPLVDVACIGVADVLRHSFNLETVELLQR